MDTGVLKILAVDNEPSVTLSLRYIFPETRYEGTGVEHGAAALTRLDRDATRYDIIIVDKKMPHLSGVELVNAIRQRGITSKIMVLSAHLSSEVRETYERMGIHVIFPKPFDIDQLRSAVDRLAA